MGRMLPEIAFFNDLAGIDVDLIHGHHLRNALCYYSIIASKLRKKPFIFTSHDPFLASGYLTSESVMGKIAGNFFKKTTEIIALSPREKQIFHDEFGIDNEKIRVIPNGLPLELYEKPLKLDFREKWGLKDSIIVLFVGQLKAFKGVPYLLQAAKKIVPNNPNVMFVIKTWNPDLLLDYKYMVQRFNIEKNVLFITNATSHEDLVDIYHSCDIYVHPSLAECLSLAILEAMACVKPVIATDVGGTAYEIIDGKTGFLVKTSNAKQLEERIGELVKSEKLRKKMGTEGYQRVIDFFSLKAISGKLETLYNEFL
jgi:glycosyltransferase involved in cell wall biosynthesis